jgi:hypothetical protein
MDEKQTLALEEKSADRTESSARPQQDLVTLISALYWSARFQMAAAKLTRQSSAASSWTQESRK